MVAQSKYCFILFLPQSSSTYIKKCSTCILDSRNTKHNANYEQIISQLQTVDFATIATTNLISRHEYRKNVNQVCKISKPNYLTLLIYICCTFFRDRLGDRTRDYIDVPLPQSVLTSNYNMEHDSACLRYNQILSTPQ